MDIVSIAVTQHLSIRSCKRMTSLPEDRSNSLRRYLHHHDKQAAKGKAAGSKAPYALVTGATGGMGEEWAYQLAHHGFNILLQGRNSSKLLKVKEEIESRRVKKGRARSSSSSSSNDNEQSNRLAVPSHVQVEILVCEATVWPNEGLRNGLKDFLSEQSHRLTIVINNLGVQSEGYPRLEDLRQEETADIVIANALFPAEVTRIALPSLKRYSPSLVVTVTSIGAWTPTPYLSPYMGTKGFDVAFSHSLRSEMLCEEAMVDVVCMVPGQVISQMCSEPESLMVPTSFNWVRSGIHSLRPGGTLANLLPYSWLASPAFQSPSPAAGSYWTRPKGVVTPWWPHYLGMLVAQYGPSWLLDSVAVFKVKGLKRKHEESLETAISETIKSTLERKTSTSKRRKRTSSTSSSKKKR